jgi:hypothetical protein
MNKLKKRIYRAIDLLAYKAAIRFDRISKWAYWKLLNIEKKENTDRIISHMNEVGSFGNDMGYEIVPETLAELFDVPAHMIHSQGHNHKPKEKK